MCQKRTDSQKPLSGACAKVQGQVTAQLQLSNQSPLMCQLGISVMRSPSQTDRIYKVYHKFRSRIVPFYFLLGYQGLLHIAYTPIVTIRVRIRAANLVTRT